MSDDLEHFTAPPPPRSPWQLLYGAAHRARRAWHRPRATSLPRPVVSIGNLHWGGGGKTPLTAAVAAHLRDSGYRVCILSRGYGSRDGGRGVRVVSDGGPPLLSPSTAGDEPVLLAGELPGVAVVVAADRAAAGRHALNSLPEPPDVFVLDDGFSHVFLHRDLDLLAFPAADPFAGGRLAPGGRLREPLSSARHADAVLLTGLASDEVPEAFGGAVPNGSATPPVSAETAGERKAAALGSSLHAYGFRGAAFACALDTGLPRLSGAPPTALAPGRRTLLVAAIARPEGFLASAHRAAEEAGLKVVGTPLTFRDHHDYPPDSLRRIHEAAAAAGADLVLTTAKDRVKLIGHLDLPLAELPVRARPQPEFWHWLDRRLRVGVAS